MKSNNNNGASGHPVPFCPRRAIFRIKFRRVRVKQEGKWHLRMTFLIAQYLKYIV